MANRILSVEIGLGLTRIAEMDFKAKNPKIYSCFQFETPPKVLADGMVTRNEAFTQLLKQSMQQAGAKTNKVVFTVNSSRIANREVKIPLVKENLIQGVINANASEYFPVDMTLYHLVYSVIEKVTDGDNKQYRLNLLAVPNDLTQSYFDLANSCGLTLEAIDYTGNSVYQLVRQTFTTGVNVVVKIDEQSSLVTVLDQGMIVLQRTAGYGIEEAIQTVQETKVFGENLSYAAALSVLHGKSCIRQFLNPESGYTEIEDTTEEITKARMAVTESLRYLIGNVSRVIDYYVSKNPDAHIEKIQLIGLGAAFSGLSKLMSNELGHKVTVFNNMQNASLAKTIENENFSLGEYAACIGAGLAPMNLIPQVEKKKFSLKGSGESSDSIVGVTVFAIILVVAAGVLAGFALYTDHQVNAKNKSLQAQVTELQPALTAYNQYTAAQTAYNNFNSMYALTTTPNSQLLAFIQELEQKMPSTVQMYSFTSDGTSVAMSMTVSSKEEAADLLIQLRTFESLSDVTTSGISEQVNEAGNTEVTITVNCTYAAPAGNATEAAQ